MITGFKLKKKLLKLINKESKKGSNGYICIKCNSLNDTDIIEALDSAALCGCRIYLIVRGACTWIPDSYPNVTIKSIIWDKLEHSRIYVFGLINPIVYIGSLDPVTSKFENRIETLVKIKDPDILIRVLEYVNKYIINYKNSWIMKDNGKYIRSKKDDRRQLDV
jgi:polyphosphate kinase